jgi:hypothetical protein
MRDNEQFSFLRDLLVENKWFFSSRVHFDDQTDMILPTINFPGVDLGTLRIAEEDLQSLWNRMGVLCFSPVLDDPRMWRQYADDGKGICLRVSCGTLGYAYRSGTVLNVPLPVEYSDDPKLPWNVLDDEREMEEVVAASLLRKSTNWVYQREWRIVRNTGGYGALPQNALCGLIFGWDVPPQVRKQIGSWITLGHRRLSYQEAVLDDDRVKVRAFHF